VKVFSCSDIRLGSLTALQTQLTLTDRHSSTNASTEFTTVASFCDSHHGYLNFGALFCAEKLLTGATQPNRKSPTKMTKSILELESTEQNWVT
jgi:hypothetical protein